MRRRTKSLEGRANKVISSWRDYHKRFVQKASSGPELYFHLRCLKFWRNMKNGLVTRDHAECLYAMLTAWGMNSRGARLAPFNEFYASLRKKRSRIAQLRRATLLDANDQDWDQLKVIWRRLTVTQPSSKYQLVGRSKVLAHLFPDWIAPIDHVHTIAFLEPAGVSSPKSESQWRVFKEIHQSFFAPTARELRKYLSSRRRRGGAYDWDTSIPKKIDNLIWGIPQQNSKKKRR